MYKLYMLLLKDINTHLLELPLVNTSHDGVVCRHITAHLVTSLMQLCPLSSNHLRFSYYFYVVLRRKCDQS